MILKPFNKFDLKQILSFKKLFFIKHGYCEICNLMNGVQLKCRDWLICKISNKKDYNDYKVFLIESVEGYEGYIIIEEYEEDNSKKIMVKDFYYDTNYNVDLFLEIIKQEFSNYYNNNFEIIYNL